MSDIVPNADVNIERLPRPSTQFVPDPDTDWDLVDSRQDDLNGIMQANIENPDGLVREINLRASSQWDDDTGFSFLHILGAELPGLKIHGAATGLVIAGSHLIEPDFESAELEASVFSLSVIDRVKARYAKLGMSIWSLARLNGGDLSDSNAPDTNLNLAYIDTDTELRRLDLTGSFLVGAQLENPAALSRATIDEIRVLQKVGRQRIDDGDVLQTALSNRFLAARGGKLLRPLMYPVRVLRDFDAESALESGHNAEGDVLIGGSFSKARMVAFDLTAAIVDDVSFEGATAHRMRGAGLISNNSDFGGIKARSSWLPGSVHIQPNLSSADISNGNWPGSVIVDPVSMRRINAESTNLDGTIIVSDVEEYPELNEQARGHIMVLPLGRLATPVRERITKITSVGLGSMKPTNKRTITR